MRIIGLFVSTFMAVLLVTAPAAAEPQPFEPRMVGDVEDGPLYVEDAVAVGDDLAYLGTHGRERLGLRWFDADRERERRLAVVWSGEMPRALAPAGDGIIFTGFRERQGTEPWRSDGTRAGTRLIKEIHQGRRPAKCAPPGDDCPTFPAGSDPSFFLALEGVTYFAANHPSYGMELWGTNGTRGGTRLVKDIRPGPGDGLAFAERSLAAFGGELYFVADDGRHGSELWRTNGTRAGTRMVRDIGPGWSVAWWTMPVVAGDYLYFAAERKAEGLELWRTDGTRKGTALVRDIRPGPKASKPEDLTAVGDLLYFTARDREHGRELWRTDGTREGTVLVADLSPGRESSDLGDLVALDESLYLTTWNRADELSRPGGLWRTDGSTDRIEPVMLGADDPVAADRRWAEYPTIAADDGRLFFTAADEAHGNELWVVDGPTSSPTLVADIRPGPEDSDPEWLTIAESTLYLTADDGEHGRQLWALPLAAAGANVEA